MAIKYYKAGIRLNPSLYCIIMMKDDDENPDGSEIAVGMEIKNGPYSIKIQNTNPLHSPADFSPVQNFGFENYDDTEDASSDPQLSVQATRATKTTAKKAAKESR